MPSFGFDERHDENERNARRAAYAARLKAKYPHLHKLELKRIVERKVR